MSKFEIKLISSGIQSLLKSSEVGAVCRQAAEQVKTRCGAGYVTSTYTGRNRVNVSVSAETPEARQDNLKNNTILKALR